MRTAQFTRSNTTIRKYLSSSSSASFNMLFTFSSSSVVEIPDVVMIVVGMVDVVEVIVEVVVEVIVDVDVVADVVVEVVVEVVVDVVVDVVVEVMVEVVVEDMIEVVVEAVVEVVINVVKVAAEFVLAVNFWQLCL